MSSRVEKFGLKVDLVLHDFIEGQALPGTGVASDVFWSGLSDIVHELGPKNRSFLDKREDLQKQIDNWHKTNRGQSHDAEAYEAFLREIGYLVPEGSDFVVETDAVDPEIATLPGPQLVVPVMNARYALNAANARWGSLYDALYGTDALGDLPGGGGYDPERGARVVARAKTFLDVAAPLAGGSWGDVTGLRVSGEMLLVNNAAGETGLADPAQFAGVGGESGGPQSYVLRKNGLHLQIIIDPSTAVGKTDPAGIADVVVEAAVSVIMDCEDSVAAVDAEDKVLAYGNWLGLMKGDLTEEVSKGGKSFTRKLNPDPEFTSPGGQQLVLKGRALMLVRNVGHLMTNPAILDRDGVEIGEGLMDAMCTALCSMHDLQKTSGDRNSVMGSVYVVKPKMHGPAEVAFTDEIFTRVEAVLGLKQYTVKIGIMDEERRTTVNLKECIRAAKN